MEKLGAIRRSKTTQCNFGSILMCTFFYVQNEFPSFGKIGRKTNRSIVVQINEYIEKMGDNFESIMTDYFEDFKKSMKQRLIILVSLVDKYINDIFFVVDIDYTYIQVVVPRFRWLRPLGYEINIDKTSTTITTLLVEEIDKSAKPFDTYDVVISKVNMDLKTTSILKKKDKIMKKLKAKFGEGVGNDDDSEEEEEEEEEKCQEPLTLTQVIGEDEEEEGAEEEQFQEAPTKLDPKKRKASTQLVAQTKHKKVTKPSPTKPIAPATRATMRAINKKSKEQVKEKKKATEQKRPMKKKLSRKYISQPDSDEARTESKDQANSEW